MTPAERRALAFLLAVAAVGTGVRALGRDEGPPPSAAERAALDAQLDRVDSARAAGERARGAGRTRRGGRRRDAAAAGRATSGRTRGDRGDPTRDPSGTAADTGRWPAAVAIAVAESRAGRPRRAAAPAGPAATAAVDLDRADAATLERLPGIGPALARRIVAERAVRGPFGSLDALADRVPGIGPTLAARIRPHLSTLP